MKSVTPYSSYHFLIRKALARFASKGGEHLYRDPSSEFRVPQLIKNKKVQHFLDMRP